MKLFSKWLLLAAASVAVFGSCDDSEEIFIPPVEEEAISVSPKTANVSSRGGDVYAMVTSSGEWEMTGEGDGYVTPSATKGKDGEVVTFTVKANDTEVDKVFSYEFTCGEKKANFTINLMHKASEEVPELSLTYVDGANAFEAEGGNVSVLVTSSETWTLEGTSEFVTPSVTEGQDGEEVVFAVAANETTEERTAEYTFKMGELQEVFQISQKGRVVRLEILSDTDVHLDFHAKEKLMVSVATDMLPEELTAEITAQGDWITFNTTRPIDGGAALYFDIQQNTTIDARVADIVIKGQKGGEAAMKVTQLPQSVISVEQPFYYADVEASNLDIPVTANVEFDVTFDAAQTWITYNGYTDGALHFAIEALGDTDRSIDITLTEKNVPEGIEPLVTVVKIKQNRSALISKVADMRQSRAYFKYLTSGRALRDLKKLSFEMLVNIQDVRQNGEVSTLMGRYNEFLLCMGDESDSSVAWNQLVLKTKTTTTTDASLILKDVNRWYHIAVTYNGTKAKFYIDGKMVYEGECETSNRGVSFDKTFSGSEFNYNRAFWIGYSYDETRYFPGYMSEVRIWNRDLQPDEILAENHFYQVEDPTNADGLVAYWKLNEGKGGEFGELIKRNKMVAEHKQGGSYVGGINWIDTRIP